jgi:Tol biopolymer transport system component/DNA-binding winged helix-turn-helix (wHTH) protein
MAEMEATRRLIRFGGFEADVKTGELRKGGVKLKFSGQPFQVLAILLERPGEVVTREELQKRLWPDTFVDVERNLNTAVNKIREVLGDSAESPRFVETLPRRGYRFIGPIEATIPPVVSAVGAEPGGHSRHRRAWQKIGAGVLAFLAIAFTGLLVFRHRPQPTQGGAVLTAVPFTALPGLAGNPAFSPDGSRIAFSWVPAPGSTGSEQAGLYVKTLGSETLLRIANGGVRPAWSPDGTQIAFHRAAGVDTGIYVVPALGGQERKLHSMTTYSTISWSADGKWIAYADQAPHDNRVRIHLLSTETLATRPIPDDPTCLKESSPAFSHKGDSLAYWCFRTDYEADPYIVSVPDGKPKMVAALSAEPDGVAWSADDKRLIYSHFRGEVPAAIDEIFVADGSVTRLGLEGRRPAVSPKGDKLAFFTDLYKTSLRRRDLLHPEAPAVELLPSSRAQYAAQYSPDGKHIVFASERSGVQGVWLSNEDGSNLVQISDPNYRAGSPHWSPDGSKIVFDAFPVDHWELYVADIADLRPRKLVTNVRSGIRPSWSHDGKWIYFASEDPGSRGIYRCPASGGDAIAISKDSHGLNPEESFDGRTVYFASYFEHPGATATVKRVPLPGQPGTESEVNAAIRLSISQNWALSPGGMYFVPPEAVRSVLFFDFASGRTRKVLETDKNITGLSVSPDGRWILYSQEGDVAGDIMLVEHFR